MTVRSVILAAAVVVPAVLGTATGGAPAADPGFDAAVQPFLKTYCLTCHDPHEKGGLRLDTLPRDFADQQAAQRWAEVLFRMNAGEMPPKKSPQPKAEELGKVVEWVSAKLKDGEAVRMARRGPVSHYRLSCEEYANTAYDLLGVNYDPTLPGGLIEDPRWHGFDRIGSLLTLSPAHVERYLTAAETVLDRAFPAAPPKATAKTADAIDIRHHGRREWMEKKGIADKVRVPVWPAAGVPGFRPWWGNVRESGVYRCRIKLSGMAGLDGRAPHLSVWHTGLRKSVFDEDVLAPEDRPVVVEFETFLSLPADLDIRNEVPPAFGDVGNHTFNVISFGETVFTGSRDPRFLNPTGYKLFTDDGKAIYPILLIDSVQWEGPLTTDAERKRREGLLPKSTDLAEARECLKRFATRAWRRPAADADVARYVKVVEGELSAGEPFPAAYRAAMVAVLASKNFYYLEGGSPAERRTHLTDWEFASRLSYFLWSSMPDDELLAAAAAGKLATPAGLREQLTRMLADPKARRFTESFPRQWLQLHRVGMFPPDPTLFRELFEEPPRGAARQRRALRRRASILDAVLDEAKTLDGRLGRDDRGRLEQYLTSVREVEVRTERADKWLDTPRPRVAPADQARLNRDVSLERLGEYLRTMYDLVVLAFQTDLTRVVTFSTGNEGVGPAVPEIGIRQDRHSLSHHNGNAKLLQDLADSDAFNVKQFAYFLDRLTEVRDADGPLVDTTMCLYGSGMAYGHSHGNASLPLVLAGGTALGLRHGRHLDFNLTPDFRGYGTHPGMYHSPVNPRARLSNLLLTMAQRVGVRAERFADSTGPVAELVG